MITIDCTIGEGSPPRIAAGMAAATDRSVNLKNIHANRDTPGLTAEEVAGIRAVADLSQAETEGLDRGSTELVFKPDGMSSGSVTAEIPGDGAVSLALQPLMIAAMAMDQTVDVRVEGGATARTHAPTISYLKNVTLPLLEQYGYEGTIEVERHAFPPGGGAVVEATFNGDGLGWIDCTADADIDTVSGISWASDDLAAGSVAERQRMSARKTLREQLPDAVDISMETAYVDATGTGCAVQLWADTPGTGIGGSGIGEEDGDAETVGQEAAEEMAYALMADGPLDEYMSDQLIPFLGLSGGTVRVRDFTDRVVSNIAVARAFTPYTLDMEADRSCITVR